MDPLKYKIGIIGLGPVGLVLAVHLKEAGCHVEICDVEKEKMNLIRNSGVKLVVTGRKPEWYMPAKLPRHLSLITHTVQ